jgi:hypothetical protein
MWLSKMPAVRDCLPIDKGGNMAAINYSNLVKELSFRKGGGGANAREMVFVQGEEMAGFDLNFIIGVYENTGDWAPGHGAHSHPFDELLVFFGYTNDLNYLGSDMELALGKEQEKHKFSVPTIVAAPRGLPHNPLITEKVYRPFGHFHIALSAKYSGDHVDREGTTNGQKYTHLFKKMPVKAGLGGADARQLMTMSGADLEGLNINLVMGLFDKPGQWDAKKGNQAHIHPYDEAMVFFSLDQTDLAHLGAELTVEIGKEHEKYNINLPTVLAFPKGTPHFPIVCNKVERPYAVMQVGLGPKYQSE